MQIIFAVILLCVIVYIRERIRSKKNAVTSDQKDRVENTDKTINSINSQKTTQAPDPRDNIKIPNKIDNQRIAYKYSKVPLSNLDFSVVKDAVDNHAWKMDVQISEDVCIVIHNEKALGKIQNSKYTRMISDWIRNDEPFLVYLENVDDENLTAAVFIVFYRDKQKYMQNREQTVVKLTAYSSESKQFIIGALENGEELDVDSEYNLNTGKEYVSVSSVGDEIGRLPKKISDRFLEEGIAGCFFEKSEYDDEKDKEIPFVRIYW